MHFIVNQEVLLFSCHYLRITWKYPNHWHNQSQIYSIYFWRISDFLMKLGTCHQQGACKVSIFDKINQQFFRIALMILWRVYIVAEILHWRRHANKLAPAHQGPKHLNYWWKRQHQNVYQQIYLDCRWYTWASLPKQSLCGKHCGIEWKENNTVAPWWCF